MCPVCLHTIFLHYILPCPTIQVRQCSIVGPVLYEKKTNLIKDKLVDLIERYFQKGRLSLYCM